MSVELSYTSGDMTVSSYGWATASGTVISENWWQKYGRFVEFQLIFTSGSGISKGAYIATDLPKPVMSGTYACLENNSKVTVTNGVYTSDNYGRLKTSVALASGTEYILHGIYISEE